MNKSDQDKENFEFTERWVEQHLPSGVEILTENLYSDFLDCIIEQNRMFDNPSRSAFLSRLGKMDFMDGRDVRAMNRQGRHVRTKAWFRVEPIEPVEPCVFSKHYKSVNEVLLRGKRGIRSWWR